MKIYEILLEEDSGVSSGDSGSADSGTTTNGGSNSLKPLLPRIPPQLLAVMLLQ